MAYGVFRHYPRIVAPKPFGLLLSKIAAVVPLYKGSKGRAAYYKGTKTDAQLYLGTKALF